MSEHFANAPFPRWPLAGAALLVVFSLLAVAMVRLTGVGVSHVPDGASIMERDFRFEDRPDGSIAVIDARDGRVVEIVTGANGFLRGTLRSLTRERKRQGMGPEQSFRLIARADGRLTLEDRATGRRVDLESFGPTNAGVFAQMLTASGNRQ